ncbi:MAG: hypothetical protein K0Q73_6963 [Paenibacillus sp.]|jgi:hypothetical protein|nr:hypothetical protein [Paenibacillus sp.]
MTISTLKRYWHQVLRNYNLLLIESCINEQMTQTLISKVEYHEMRLNALDL